MPLVNYSLDILFHVPFQFISIIFKSIAFPLFALIVLLAGIIYVLFRTVLDYIILKVIIKKMAKIPSRNTLYA
jgi:hypothetical protein